MIRVALVGSGFDNLEPEGTTLAREELEIVVVDGGDLSPLSSGGPAPRLVVIDTRSVGARTQEIVETLRGVAGASPIAIVLAVPGLDRERWESHGADGLVTRPLTTARLLDAIRRHVPMEERGADRSEQVLKVEMASPGTDWVAFTRDIGATGLFVHGAAPFSENDEVSVRFHLPGEPGGASFEGAARVVRVERDDDGVVEGAALHFVGLTASDRGRLARWLREKGHGAG